jgi:hypothetical protein
MSKLYSERHAISRGKLQAIPFGVPPSGGSGAFVQNRLKAELQA